MIKIVEFLYPILPACVTFGPAFLFFGVIIHVGEYNSRKFNKGTIFLLLGTLMITYALNVLMVMAIKSS